MKKTTYLLFTLLCILMISCRIDVNYDLKGQSKYEGSESWMSHLGDSKLLKDTSIPGTHDTCANYDFMGLSSTAAAQDLSLQQQLEAGIRYVDIRVCKEGDNYVIKHGPTHQHMTFSDVINTLTQFLAQNPSETIIMAMLAESSDIGDFSNLYSYLKQYKNDSRFIMGQNASTLELVDCRGKIVVVKRASAPVEMNDVFCTGYTETGAAYKTSNLDSQWQLIKTALENSSRTSLLTAIYSAGYYEGQFGIPNIRIASSSINPRLIGWIKDNQNPGSLGIVVSDHTTYDLAYAVYMTNF